MNYDDLLKENERLRKVVRSLLWVLYRDVSCQNRLMVECGCRKCVSERACELLNKEGEK